MRVLVVLGALALAGCATPTGSVQSLPPNYRQLIADYARTQYYFDPYSIRDAAIATTVGSDFGIYGTVQTVCVRANAKNRMGGYIGIMASMFSLREGKVVGAIQDTNGLICGGAAYEPFPELEDGGRGAPGKTQPPSR